MPDENKRNVHYFEAESMSALFDSLQAWQNGTGKRFLSVAISEDHAKFCCIALTNPTEVVITDSSGRNAVDLVNGRLKVLNQMG